MLRALLVYFALLAAAVDYSPAQPQKSAPPNSAAKQLALKSASIDDNSSPSMPGADPQAEAQLLELANRDRAVAGLPAFVADPGLTRAARTHALTWTQARHVSHQFAVEPALPRRIAAATSLRIDQAGENVALDVDVES